MPPVEFEPTISAGERPQTHALDRAVTGTGITWDIVEINFHFTSFHLTRSLRGTD